MDVVLYLPDQTVLTINLNKQLSHPRKAWKKRRRTQGPLLVPCDIMGMNINDDAFENVVDDNNVDLKCATTTTNKEILLWNIVNLLHLYGKVTLKNNNYNNNNNNDNDNNNMELLGGVALSVKSLTKLYNSKLNDNLMVSYFFVCCYIYIIIIFLLVKRILISFI